MDTENLKLEPDELSLINEISEESSIQASQAISVMTNQELSVEISDTRMVRIEDLQKSTESKGIVVAIYMKIDEELDGEIALLFPEKSALEMVDLLLKKPNGTTKSLDTLEKSALREIGNILVGNYLTVLSNKLGVNALGSVPDMAVDMEESILNSIAIELTSRSSNETLVFEMKFQVNKEATEGRMLVLFDEESIKKIKKLCQEKSTK